MDFILLVLMLVLAVGLLAYSLWPSRAAEIDAVLRRIAGVNGPADDGKDAASNSVFVKAAPFLSRPMMPKTDAEQFNLKTRLMNAGYRSESVPVLFLASKTAAGAMGGFLGGFLAYVGGKSLLAGAGQAALGAGVGFMLPNLWLWLVIKERCQKILHGLPDALDLLVVSVEAGLGLDAALQRVGDEMRHVHPQLADELQVATIETQMGVPRANAMTRMAERSGVQEVRSLVAVLIQAEKLGTSISQALRNQADSLRTKRRQKAEERAQKTAVKLMLPLILFIFPAILVVLVGPAGIKLAQTMSMGSGTALSGD